MALYFLSKHELLAVGFELTTITNLDLILLKNFSVDLRWILPRQKFCKEISGQKFWSSNIQRNSTLKNFYRIGGPCLTFDL